MNGIVQSYLKSKKLRFIVGLLLSAIVTAIFAYFELLDYIPIIVLIFYIIFQMLFRKENFWQVRFMFYFAEAMISAFAVSEPKYIVTAIAGVEAFDLIFKHWLCSEIDKFIPKITSYFKELCTATFGYRLCGLRKLILYFKKHKI